MATDRLPIDPDLAWLGEMMGANGIFSDGEIITLLCPELEGKTMKELSPSEFERLMTAAQSFPLSKITEDEED